MVLKLEFKNAFNTIQRDEPMRVGMKFFLDYATYVWQCYRHEPVLLYGDKAIDSATDVQQGDPLGPLLFCSAIKALTATSRSPFNVWFLDHGCLRGPLAEIFSDLEAIMASADIFGLELNFSKCEAHVFGVTAIEREIAQVSRHAISADIRLGSWYSRKVVFTWVTRNICFCEAITDRQIGRG